VIKGRNQEPNPEDEEGQHESDSIARLQNSQQKGGEYRKIGKIFLTRDQEQADNYNLLWEWAV